MNTAQIQNRLVLIDASYYLLDNPFRTDVNLCLRSLQITRSRDVSVRASARQARQWVKSPATSPASTPPPKKGLLKRLEKVGNNDWVKVEISSNSLSTPQLVLKDTHTQKGLILYVLIFFQ